ncbi:MAG: hypothetical protein M5R42_01960 [Rhodocyclaceae bacterium]|nr:hypothetical protein [Rhodocyclaceae bacterium]
MHGAAQGRWRHGGVQVSGGIRHSRYLRTCWSTTAWRAAPVVFEDNPVHPEPGGPRGQRVAHMGTLVTNFNS